MTLGLVDFQNILYVTVQRPVDMTKTLGDVFMYRTLADSEFFRRRPDSDFVFQDIFPELYRPKGEDMRPGEGVK